MSAIGEDEIAYRQRLARSQEATNEFENAEASFIGTIAAIEAREGSLSRRLIEPLIGLGRVQMELGELTTAEEHLRRAQHLTHRHDGVLSARQLEVIDLVTRMRMTQNDPLGADLQQNFRLYVVERTSEEGGADHLAALEAQGQWYLDTGQYRKARKTFERQIEVVRRQHGSTDERLLKPLRHVAKARQLAGICCSYEPLEEALAILEKGADDPATVAHAMADLADAYTIARRVEDAAEMYREAWRLLDEAARPEEREPTDLRFHEPRQIAMSRHINQPVVRVRMLKPGPADGYRRSRHVTHLGRQLTPAEKLTVANQVPQIFWIPVTESRYNQHLVEPSIEMEDTERTRLVVGHPIQFQQNQLLHILPFSQQDQLAELYIELEFTVQRTGKIADITVLDTNAPQKLVRTTRLALAQARFRPRLHAGEPTDTTNVQFRQTFE